LNPIFNEKDLGCLLRDKLKFNQPKHSTHNFQHLTNTVSIISEHKNSIRIRINSNAT